MLSLAECQEKIVVALNTLNISGKPDNLYEPIRYILSLGGKRIRPALVLMGCNVFSDHYEDAIHAALAVEIFHNFTLLHDDVMDKAVIRRNKPTVHKKWNESAAILSGDAMMMKAYQVLMNSPANKLQTLLRIFNQSSLEICEGQQYDMDFEKLNFVTEDEYIEMIRLKTAVLIGSSLKMGAVIGNAGEKSLEQIYYFGEKMGLAFQLQDDLLDVFAESSDFGKETGGDIVANKKTFLLINALRLAKGLTRERLMEFLSEKNIDREEKVKEMKAIYQELDVKKLTEEKIQHFFSLSLESLEKVDAPVERKENLKAFVFQLMNRKK